MTPCDEPIIDVLHELREKNGNSGARLGDVCETCNVAGFIPEKLVRNSLGRKQVARKMSTDTGLAWFTGSLGGVNILERPFQSEQVESRGAFGILNTWTSEVRKAANRVRCLVSKVFSAHVGSVSLPNIGFPSAIIAILRRVN